MEKCERALLNMKQRDKLKEDGELRNSAAGTYICSSGKPLEKKRVVYLAIAQIGNKSSDEVFPPPQKKSMSKYNISFYNDTHEEIAVVVQSVAAWLQENGERMRK